MITRFIAAASVIILCSAMAENPVSAIAEDGRILVNGEPRYIIGLYEYVHNKARLRDAVDAGFNFFHGLPDQDYLDRIASVNSHAWINLGMRLNIDDNQTDELDAYIDRFKDHPAVGLWSGPDEALWHVWYTPLEYYWSGAEYTAMRESGRDEPAYAEEELEEDISQLKDLISRALWEDADNLRAAIWDRLGQPMPRPDLQLAPMAREAVELGNRLNEGIERVKERDPRRLIWLNHAPRNSIAALAHYNQAADIVGCDIYPVPMELPQRHSDLSVQTLSSVGAYTRRMAEAAPGKPIVMILQAFGWADIHHSIKERAQRSGKPFGRRPTYQESRFMAYDAIVNGAAAIFFWGTHRMERESPLWYDLLDLVRELDALQPFLSASASSAQPEITAHEGYGSIDADDLFCLMKESDGHYALIVVNEAMASSAFTVDRLPEALEGRTLYRLGSPESLTVEERSISDGIAGFDAHVYATSRKFETVRTKITEEMPDNLPASIKQVLNNTEPLEYPRNDRLPLYLWPARNPPRMTVAEARTLVRALNDRGIGLVSRWNHNQTNESLATSLPIARAQRDVGQPIAVEATSLLYSFFDGDERTAHIDEDGNPFWEDSFGKANMGCPFTLEFRKTAIRNRLKPFIERYAAENLPVDFIFVDWEIDGPIEWNNAWESSKRCRRCRENIPDIDTNFLAFQHAIRSLRSELQHDVYAAPVLETFPNALVGNYAVYPHNGYRYWYDYFERYTEGQPEIREQGARYRLWANEFPETGYTMAMPVVYPWSWTYNWYDFAIPDYRWFYNMLKVGSNAGRHTPVEVPIVTFVHWHTVEVGAEVGGGARDVTPEGEQISAWAYQELLWHLLLRRHDTFFMWCRTQENQREIELLHPVYREAQAYGEFLDQGRPINFSVPNQPGTVVSGLVHGNRVLVRRTDFIENDEPVTISIGTRTIEVPAVPGECQILRLPAK